VTGPAVGDASQAPGDASQAPTDADGGSRGPTMNVARLGIARASSVFGFSIAARVIDGDPATSWYPAGGSCRSGSQGGAAWVCGGDATYVEVALDAPRTIERVRILGNRDAYKSGYDTLTGRIVLLASGDIPAYSSDVTATRGDEPNGDVDHVVDPPAANVTTVRFVVLTGEASTPGIGELEALGR
jgi:hypothetical protein